MLHLRLPTDTTVNANRYDNYTFGTVVKQADTVLLGFPLEIDFNMSAVARANDLDAYGGNYTDSGGPAMTWGAFAIGCVTPRFRMSTFPSTAISLLLRPYAP